MDQIMYGEPIELINEDLDLVSGGFSRPVIDRPDIDVDIDRPIIHRPVIDIDRPVISL
jgi:hypothetical protein